MNILRTTYQIAKNVSSAYDAAHQAAFVIIPAIFEANHVSDANHLVDVTRDANVAIESRDNAYAAARATDYAFTDARRGLVSYDVALAISDTNNAKAICYSADARAANSRVKAACEMIIREEKARQEAAKNAARDESMRQMFAHSEADRAARAARAAAKLAKAERAAAKLANAESAAEKLANAESAATVDDKQGGAYKKFNNDEYYAKYMKYKTKYFNLKN